MSELHAYIVETIEHTGYAHPVSFGKNVRRLRQALEMKQGDLARLLGIKPSGISNYENDRSGLPETPTLLKFAKALDCSIEDLLVGVDAQYDEIVKRRDLSRHDDHGSSSAAHSQTQRKGTHDETGATTTRLLHHILGRRKAFIRDVENVADLLREVITAEERRLARETEEAPAPAASRRSHRRKAG